MLPLGEGRSLMRYLGATQASIGAWQARSPAGRYRVAAFLLLGTLAGCSTGVLPPTVDVLQGQLVSAGLLDQQLQVVLCVTNPNMREIALKRVTFGFSLAGDTLATGASEAPLDLPPGGAVPVPFVVNTSTRDLGAPLASIFQQGALDYVVSGRVVLRDFALVGIPYSVRGRITASKAAGQLFSLATAAPTTSACLSSRTAAASLP